MNKHYLLHLGAGNVGQELVRQIQARPHNLIYCGLFCLDGGRFNAAGLTESEIADFAAGTAIAAQALEQISLPFTLIDTTASAGTLPLLRRAIERGATVAMSNKKPLAGPQADWDELVKSGRVYFETTVGAGLPVINTLQALLATGDEVEQIQGCFSGTLGYLFSQLESGAAFSQALADAKAQGFTEPDPRDDLSGADVARKAVILARLIGRKLEVADVKLEGLFPADMAGLSRDEFMANLGRLDADYAARAAKAKAQGKVLRYVATVTPETCKVGLEQVPAPSDIGALSGPDNIVVIQTKRYHDNPLIIKGPGAGLPVTAAGVFADILTAAKVR